MKIGGMRGVRANEVVLIILEILFSLGVAGEKNERKRGQLLIGLGICVAGLVTAQIFG